ncbi:MAG: osmotically inducible protein OsmC [Kordia sp.]|nr:MAG: osmotically inducible protein OsmC [Kordia sp.]
MKNAASKTILSRDSYKAIAFSRSHEMNMDRPFEDGGNDISATPIEYLLTAIGGCVSMTLRVFANHKRWDLGEITVNVLQKNKLTSSGLITFLVEEISFEKEVTQEQKEELLIMAGKCPVAQLLKKETNIQSIIK